MHLAENMTLVKRPAIRSRPPVMEVGLLAFLERFEVMRVVCEVERSHTVAWILILVTICADGLEVPSAHEHVKSL